MIYYTSDLHLGHANVIRFDGRPFMDVEEMERKIIENWNSVVKNEDTVYILGDFCWSTDDEWDRILSLLNGQKVLIRGNHDLKNMTQKVRRHFQDVKDYKEISDNGRRVIMCHYPMPFYRADYNENVYHLYGHLHITVEETYMQEIKKYIKERDIRGNSSDKCQFYNCWLGFYDYKPATLDQIIERWRDT